MAKVTQLKVELEQEEDGRWIGEVPTLPGVMAYGQTKAAALAAVQEEIKGVGSLFRAEYTSLFYQPSPLRAG